MGEAGCEPRPPEEDPPCTPADPYDELYEFEAWSLADLEKLTEALHEYATTVKDVFSISDDSWSQIAAATQREPAKLREAVWQVHTTHCARADESLGYARALQGRTCSRYIRATRSLQRIKAPCFWGLLRRPRTGCLCTFTRFGRSCNSCFLRLTGFTLNRWVAAHCSRVKWILYGRATAWSIRRCQPATCTNTSKPASATSSTSLSTP